MKGRRFLFVFSLLFVFIGGAAFAEDVPHVVFILHEGEYETAKTVPVFAEEALVKGLGWKCTYLHGKGMHNIPGLEVLKDADLMFVSVRRRQLPAEQFRHIKAYCDSGKPIVGIRTTSHAFALRSGEPSENGIEWPEFDTEVLGGHYKGHHGNRKPGDPKTSVWAAPEAFDHPILRGVRKDEFTSSGTLYKTSPLVESATVLMLGRVADAKPHEPVAWTNITEKGNRVFYTSLGHADDFKEEHFRRLLRNGIVWALGKDVGE